MPRPLLIAIFRSEPALRHAVERLIARGARIHDVYTPYPVHGLSRLIASRGSRLPLVALAGGVGGCAGAFAMEVFMAVIDWPLNVGGKPLNSTLAFVPIAFELTILSAALFAAGALLVGAKLLPGMRPARLIDGVTDDVFALALRRGDDTDQARRVLTDCGAALIAESGRSA